MATITENLQTIKDSTMAIKQAILDKGGEVGDLTTYADAITNLPSGDPNPTAEKNDVTFYDYDGTIRYSYTAEEFLALTEMPPLPTQKGLTCQEWNWSYKDAMEYVAEYGVLDVGATYITDDGKTRLYIRIATEGRMDVPLYFQQTIANGVTIDWGDGSATETLDGTGKVNTTHRYASIGDYMISLDVVDGCTLVFGQGSNYSVMGSTGNKGKVYCNMLKRVEIGNNVVEIRDNAFSYCSSLSSIIIPHTITYIGYNIFTDCYSLSFIVIPKSVTSIASSVLQRCNSLQNAIIPKSISIIGAMFNSCSSLSTFTMPPLTTIGFNMFQNCISLTSVIIPASVKSINALVFSNCYGMAYYDFSHHTAVPTLANTNAFTGIPSDCKIIVPDVLYDEWIAATNWSAYATYTIKKSEWDNLKQGGSL